MLFCFYTLPWSWYSVTATGKTGHDLDKDTKEDACNRNQAEDAQPVMAWDGWASDMQKTASVSVEPTEEGRCRHKKGVRNIQENYSWRCAWEILAFSPRRKGPT